MMGIEIPVGPFLIYKPVIHLALKSGPDLWYLLLVE